MLFTYQAVYYPVPNYFAIIFGFEILLDLVFAVIMACFFCFFASHVQNLQFLLCYLTKNTSLNSKSKAQSKHINISIHQHLEAGNSQQLAQRQTAQQVEQSELKQHARRKQRQ